MQGILHEFAADDHLVPFAAMEVSGPLPLQLSSMLSARLERAATDQLVRDDATLSRYAIWAETIRGILLDAIESLDDSVALSVARRNLIRAANSLAAFSIIQTRLEANRASPM